MLTFSDDKEALHLLTTCPARLKTHSLGTLEAGIAMYFFANFAIEGYNNSLAFHQAKGSSLLTGSALYLSNYSTAFMSA